MPFFDGKNTLKAYDFITIFLVDLSNLMATLLLAIVYGHEAPKNNKLLQDTASRQVYPSLEKLYVNRSYSQKLLINCYHQVFNCTHPHAFIINTISHERLKNR